MVEYLVVPLVLAALTGLTFVAYRHPLGYKRISLPLGATVLSLALLDISYYFGRTVAAIDVLKKRLDSFPERTLQSSDRLINDMCQNSNTILVVLGVSVPILGYLLFLYFLPKILECKPDGKQDTRTDERT